MQPYNQLILPHSVYSEDNFYFYGQGVQLYSQEPDLREDCENKIRVQLEQSDMIQGFQVLCDTNSGYGSLAQIMIQDMI